MDHVKSIIAYSSTVPAYNTESFNASTADIDRNVQRTEFVFSMCLNTRSQYARVAKYFYMLPAVLQIIEEKARNLSEVTHLENKKFLFSNTTDVVLLL